VVCYGFRFTNVVDQDYHWVITVPAIWVDGAKQFMREAAEMVLKYTFTLTFVLVEKYKEMFINVIVVIVVLNCDVQSLCNICFLPTPAIDLVRR